MKALVTGANGFLGSYLVEELQRTGHEVVGMVRRQQAAVSGSGVEYVLGDIRNADAVDEALSGGFDVVFHTAAVAGIWGTWKFFHSTNTIGTRNIVQACLKHDIPKLVYTSSPSVTFNGQHQTNIDETTPYSQTWLAHYPHSKALAEQYVLEANDEPSFMTCSLRPHLIWGPGDNHLIPRIVQRAKQKKLRRVGDGTNQVDNIYVENAAHAHVLAAEAMQPGSPVCGSAYFISQGDPVNCWQWINEILELARAPRVKQSISYLWAYRLGYLLETVHGMFDLKGEPRMTRFLAAQLAKSHYYDIGRAKRDFNFYPRVTMSEGMKRLGDWLSSESGE
ncbi:MAG: NAD-dependent epimerase/dehydratase family protein [Planctomycetota bacterium]